MQDQQEGADATARGELAEYASAFQTRFVQMRTLGATAHAGTGSEERDSHRDSKTERQRHTWRNTPTQTD